MNTKINGISCILCYGERIPQEKAHIGYPYSYHIRHDEDDWTCPISIERFVVVNFFGTVFMKKPLEFGADDYIEIEQFELEGECVKFTLNGALLNRMLGL